MRSFQIYPNQVGGSNKYTWSATNADQGTYNWCTQNGTQTEVCTGESSNNSIRTIDNGLCQRVREAYTGDYGEMNCNIVTPTITPTVTFEPITPEPTLVITPIITPQPTTLPIAEDIRTEQPTTFATIAPSPIPTLYYPYELDESGIPIIAPGKTEIQPTEQPINQSSLAVTGLSSMFNIIIITISIIVFVLMASSLKIEDEEEKYE